MDYPFYIEPASTRHWFIGIRFIPMSKKIKPNPVYYFAVDRLDTLPNIGDTIQVEAIQRVYQDEYNPYKLYEEPIKEKPYKNSAKVECIIEDVDIGDFHKPLYAIGANGSWAQLIKYVKC